MNDVVTQVALPAVMKNANATPLFISRCTIRQPSGNLIDAGQPDGNYTDVTGCANIPCTAPPMSSVRLQATDVRSMDDIQAFSPLHVLLNGWFPQIQAGVAQGWIAVIDGQVLTLMGAEDDSQKRMTRLSVRFGAV